MTDRRIPDLGPNPIQDALHNYQQMEHDLGIAREELAAKNDMVQDLLRENEFLRRNYDKAVTERDRYQALGVNLATRAVGVKEAVERLLAEAVGGKAAPAPGDLTGEMEKLLSSAASGREITARTTALAPNRFQ
jgi:hypothetical protein